MDPDSHHFTVERVDSVIAVCWRGMWKRFDVPFKIVILVLIKNVKLKKKKHKTAFNQRDGGAGSLLFFQSPLHSGCPTEKAAADTSDLLEFQKSSRSKLSTHTRFFGRPHKLPKTPRYIWKHFWAGVKKRPRNAPAPSPFWEQF